MEYRFLCAVPYKDMQLDRDYMAHDQAAAEILVPIGHLTHTPDNPGWPDNEYQFAYKGTTSSNLDGASGARVTAPESVEGYMNDSNRNNIDRVGHRRWCLNPMMLKTGFGVAGGFSAMWSFDTSRSDTPDYEAVAYPPRGIMPSTHFKTAYAWSVSPNPQKYRSPDSSVRATVTPVRFDPEKLLLEKDAKALAIEYFQVSETSFGGASCIIFRPRDVSIANWSAYFVEIRGLKDLKGQDTPAQYFVGFYNPAEIKPPERTNAAVER
jgi:hypothetical protein